MFGIGWSELIVIALAFLLFVGPKDLPKMMQRIGRLMRELSNASRELRNQLDAELGDVPTPRKIARELTEEARELVRSPYDEVREIDARMKKELAEIRDEPRFEPKAEGEKAEGEKAEGEKAEGEKAEGEKAEAPGKGDYAG